MLSANTFDNPCITCKKRRVKSDSAQPRCHRCQKDGRECLGYHNHFKWIHVQPQKRKKDKQAKPGSTQSGISKSSNLADDHTGVTSTLPDIQLAVFSPAAPISDLDQLRRCWHINDSIEYNISVVIPDLVPYPYGSTYSKLMPQWKRAPSLLQSIVLVVTYNHRIVRRVNDNQAVTDLYRYRGEALHELATELGATGKLPTFMALVCVLMVLQAEIQLSAISQWDIHLRAARSFIDGLGGIVQCWRDLPSVQMLLSLHFLIEVMYPVTTPTSLLSSKELEAADDYIFKLPGIEHNLQSTCCPLPLPVLTAITQTNYFRKRLSCGVDADYASAYKSLQALVASFQSILRQLDKFEPAAWAARTIAEFPDTGIHAERAAPLFRETELSEWTAIGQCYQSATIIYLLRSATSCSSSRSYAILSIIASTATDRLSAEVYTLGTTLNSLFLSFPDRRPTCLRPGLWRFTMFPLFIHALELLVWQQQTHPAPSTAAQHRHLERMRSVGRVLGCRAMTSAAECVEGALQLRKRLGRALSWDGCFKGRSVFVV